MPFGFAGQIAYRAQRFFASVLQALAMLQKSLTGFGQRHLAGTAIKQAGLQSLFKSRYLAADMG